MPHDRADNSAAAPQHVPMPLTGCAAGALTASGPSSSCADTCCVLACAHLLLQVITPLLRILEKMHSMMLLHRDIKPENIFLTGMGKFKIGDFGLAIRFDKELPFSRSGTLDYMAPEVGL